MHTTTNPSVAAAADQIEATLANVRRLTARNRLLADPVAGDQYVIDCLTVNLHAQWAAIDEIDFETDGTLPTAFPRVVQADHYEGEGGWPPPAEANRLNDETKPIATRRRGICYRCLDPLRRSPAREQLLRTLWVGKGVYIAEFHFCESNCVQFFERILPTIEWKVNPRAV